MRPVRITEPAELPVTVAEAKEHVIIDFADDDALVERLIMAAADHLDGYGGILGRCMVDQEWRQDYAGWAPSLRLPFPNVSAAAVECTDADGSTQTVAASDYEIVEDARGARVQFLGGFVRPALAAISAPVRVTFTAGYGDALAVPMDIKVAISLMVKLDYDQPDPQIARSLQNAIDAKIGKHRWFTP